MKIYLLDLLVLLAVLVNNVICSESKGNNVTGRYLELNQNKTTHYYMFTNKECTKMYLCKTHLDEGVWPLQWNALTDCYFRDDKIDYKFSDIYDPDRCDVKGYVDILSEKCYISTLMDKSEITYSEKVKYGNARYYDIDYENNLALTEWGWCNFTLNNNDAKWMSKLDPNLKLNQIIIPGTHDSGTYAIHENTSILDILGFQRNARELYFRTQNWDIKEQLQNGIRYFDIRIETNNNKEIYLSHVMADAYNRKTGKNYYLTDVFDEVVDFLHYNNEETVILHLKDENIVDYYYDHPEEFAGDVAKLSYFNEKYKDYFYNDKFNLYEKDEIYIKEPIIPTLNKTRGKIVILMRQNFYYEISNNYKKINENDIKYSHLGIQVAIKDMAKCDEYDGPENIHYDNAVCFPIIYNNNRIRLQDNYGMDYKDKWSLVNDMLDHKSRARTEENDYKDFIIYDANNVINDSFYNPKNTDVLTINFMNIKADYLNDTAIGLAPITRKAKYMNNHLSDYIKADTRFINEWFILDFPTRDLIRKIWQSNFVGIKDYKNDNINLDTYDVIHDFDYYAVAFRSTFAYKRQNENNKEETKACLQRKIIFEGQETESEVIKTNYKCIDNKMNKWRLNKNNNFYNIISSYDAKCLSNSNGELQMQKCDENNKYQDFTIEDGIICSRINKSQCLENKYKFVPASLNSLRYDHLTCSSIYAELGFDCCSNKNIQVEYVDEIGNWGIENGKLCGIGYDRCSWSAFGYPCCNSINPEVKYTDELGTWGIEDGQWCGIGEVVYNSKIRIKNKKTQECLITNLHSDTNILLMGDCNHSEWTFINDKLVMDATGKCLYAMNSKNGKMIECNKADDQINHHIHFKIVDGKFICIKNNVDPDDYCLDGKTLNFETVKSEYSDWIIENLNPNNKIIGSISEIIRNNPSLLNEKIKPVTSVTTTITSTPTTTSTVSDIAKPTATVKPGHIVYWFYHAITNKCLYAPQNKNGKITIKLCDDSNYSKWMVLSSRKGYFYSMAYPDYCLRIDDTKTGTLSLGKCDDQAKLEHNNDGYFELIGTTDKCIGLLNEKDMYNNEIELNLNTCAKTDAEKFYTWDHNPTPSTVCFSEALGYPCCSDPNTAVVTTDSDGQWGIENDKWCGILGSEKDIPTLTPTINTETYYLYNAYMNQCIHSDGILGSPITLDNCDYTTYSLWDIPYTHNGNFHLKFNEKHCLMVIDDISLVLGECGKDGTTFYREGNYIMSPLYKNKCIGLDTGSTLVMSDCNEFDKTQIFFFNLWTEPPLES